MSKSGRLPFLSDTKVIAAFILCSLLLAYPLSPFTHFHPLD